MELRTLAQQVLFSERIESKLHRPERLVDEAPGPPLRSPDVPARPPGLGLNEGGERTPFPRLSQLDDPVARGRVLHFFANHELLAMELMAVALLRFTDAPPAWRMGLARILLEEQDHMRLYLDRMDALGVRFGEQGVSPFFWTCLADVASPRDFAAGMSLTFEVANLDWCRFYGAAVREVGDSETDALLERVYQEEIRHVAHGLRWFRRWKDPKSSDWDAYVRSLSLPLSPARARGKVFDRAGREAAGLHPDHIDRLQTFSRSRGRPPWVYSFEGGIEIEAAGRNPNKAVRTLRADLAALPHLLARADDIVLAPEQRPAFLLQLQEAGFELPEFRPTIPRARIIAGLRPFGVAGDHLRRSAVTALRDDVVVCRSLSEIPDGDIVLKSEFSSSGRGVCFSRDLEWAAQRLRRDGLVLAEPRYELVQEVGAQFVDGRFLGFTWPLVDDGIWRGHLLIPPRGDIRRFLFEGQRAERFVRALPLPETCGVDLAVVRQGDTLRLQVLELNARMTMGHYALALKKRAPWAARFRVVGKRSVPAGAICLTDPETASTLVAIAEKDVT